MALSRKSYVFSLINAMSRFLDRLSKRRALVIILIALLSFIGSWVYASYTGVNKPQCHDEFSYLLAADTFAHGRLTNPAHPMGSHFETFHVLQQPTYMSKYPPAQGLFLAFGQVVFKHPIFGIWLSAAMMCGAITWMLYGWLPPRWAVIGGLISALQFGIFTYWSQSYWGGAVPALGGALVFGSVRRIIRSLHIRDTLLMGLGIAVLLNSRPFEGLVTLVPVSLLLLAWIFGKWRPKPNKLIPCFLLPLLLIVSLTFLGIAAYNKAITGDCFQMPYLLYEKTHSCVPLFIGSPLRPAPVYQNETMRAYDIIFLKKEFALKNAGFFKYVWGELKKYAHFYLNPILSSVALLMLFWMLKNRWAQFVIAAIFIITLYTIVPISCMTQNHYIAPITCLLIFVVSQALRYLYLLRLRWVSIGGISVFLILSLFLIHNFIEIEIVKKTSVATTRPAIIKQLEDIGGKHLVLVKYSKCHNLNNEWVYNGADIDNAPIVWARRIGEYKDRELIKYFKDRRAWLLEITNDNSYQLSPLS